MSNYIHRFTQNAVLANRFKTMHGANWLQREKFLLFFTEDASSVSRIWQVKKHVIHFRLEEIEAQNNVLAAIPGTVTKLNDLRYLDVSNNKLKSLPATLNKVFVHIF